MCRWGRLVAFNHSLSHRRATISPQIQPKPQTQSLKLTFQFEPQPTKAPLGKEAAFRSSVLCLVDDTLGSLNRLNSTQRDQSDSTATSGNGLIVIPVPLSPTSVHGEYQLNCLPRAHCRTALRLNHPACTGSRVSRKLFLVPLYILRPWQFINQNRPGTATVLATPKATFQGPDCHSSVTPFSRIRAPVVRTRPESRPRPTSRF